jgi:signal transduction histidine kinase
MTVAGRAAALARALRDYPRTLAGQLALVLSIGMAISALVALKLSDSIHERTFREEQIDATIASAIDIVGRYRLNPAQTTTALEQGQIVGALAAEAGWRMTRPDRDLSHRLAQRIGQPARVMLLPHQVCFARFLRMPRAAGVQIETLPDCWLIELGDARTPLLRYIVDYWPTKSALHSPIGPPYLELIMLAGAVLGLIAASIATAPLRRMERAARAFSLVGDFEPIPVNGPSEVRAALETFNLAQERVRESLRERTQILAAVTHDLQTPLTRLRLRLEQVDDETLRARLVADLAATQQMVRDGLDLARSSEMREPWSVIDIDSVLSSLAEDAAEFGHAVVFVQGCAMQLRVKPNALARALDNLVDNAIKYGGGAELSSLRDGTDLVIRVADRGPGIAEADIALALQPFRRLSSSQGGTGIGLPIAQAQVATFGARLTLRRREGGGLIAEIRKQV